MSENKSSEIEAAVDDLMGGQKDYSPEDKTPAEKSPEPQHEKAPEAEDEFIPYGDDEYGFFSDSATQEQQDKKPESAPEEKDSAPEEKKSETKVPEVDVAALQAELANYQKRLHDTQKAMHEANTAKAELQKELDSLRQKKDDDGEDDDWFSDDDKEKKAVEKIEKELAEVKQQSDDLKHQQQEYQQELLRQKWFKEAEAFSKEHDDFEELVYRKLEPMLNEETGDPMIRTLYLKQEDRTPAGAYEFAKKLFGYQDKLNGSAVPPEKKENKAEDKIDPARGKAGLDRMNSAEFAEDRKRNRNMVEDIFG
jgi:chromosome segregation ATPase